jgi:cysteine desulfurase / selenocysteine lyase
MSAKASFPFFAAHPELVYLDSAATTQKPISVIEALDAFYRTQNVNVHRGSYSSAKSLTSLYENTRHAVADLINAPSSKNIAWTKGTTDSINVVAQSWARHQLKPGDRIVLLASEHHANIVPWQQVALQVGAHIDFVELTDEHVVDLSHFKQLLAVKPALVAIQHVSNALGNIHPIEEMAALIRDANTAETKFLIDGAQAISHLNVDVQALDCDFYAFSAHKMYGPTGVGVLYVANEVVDQMLPVNFGGEMITNVSRAGSCFQKFPGLLETGTPNISGIVGLAAAVEYVTSNEYQSLHNSVSELYSLLLHELQQFPQVKVYGDCDNNVGIVSFTIIDESVADVGMLLDQQGIAVRVGHHCAMPLMHSLSIDGTIRVSLSVYNDKNDIVRFIAALKSTIKMLDI